MAASMLDDELSCPICCITFTDPRLLPCAHNFCLPCLESVLQRRSKKKFTLMCPLCRQVHEFYKQDDLRNLKKNYALMGVIEKLERCPNPEATKHENVLVDVCCVCKKDNSVLSCSECHSSYCSKCQHVHTIQHSKGTLSVEDGQKHDDIVGKEIKEEPLDRKLPDNPTDGKKANSAGPMVNREASVRWFKETQANIFQDSVPTWFHGIITRSEAEQLLDEKPIGCFLLRVGESRLGFSLSFRGETRCIHYMINHTESNTYVVVGENKYHDTLEEIIEFYTRHTLPSSRHILTVACGQHDGECDYEELMNLPSRRAPPPPLPPDVPPPPRPPPRLPPRAQQSQSHGTTSTSPGQTKASHNPSSAPMLPPRNPVTKGSHLKK